MVGKILALLEGLSSPDLSVARPIDLERFAAMCRYWASIAEAIRQPDKDIDSAG